jgi:hypothetical protein
MAINDLKPNDGSPESLVFVYNADSGLFNALTDSVHKVVSPGTYQCNLCRLTYGIVGMRDKWKIFLQSLEITVMFLHRDQLHEIGVKSLKEELPAVFIKNASGIRLAISAEKITSCKTVDELMELVTNVIAEIYHKGH